MNIESITEFQVHRSRDSDATAAKTPLEVMTDSTGEISEMMPRLSVLSHLHASIRSPRLLVAALTFFLRKMNKIERDNMGMQWMMRLK